MAVKSLPRAHCRTAIYTSYREAFRRERISVRLCIRGRSERYTRCARACIFCVCSAARSSDGHGLLCSVPRRSVSREYSSATAADAANALPKWSAGATKQGARARAQSG